VFLQEAQVEGREHQDDAEVNHQPLPQVVPEEQNIDANNDADHQDHVKHDGCLSSHTYFVPRVPEQGATEILLLSKRWKQVDGRVGSQGNGS
jgi:hypothetical protein